MKDDMIFSLTVTLFSSFLLRLSVCLRHFPRTLRQAEQEVLEDESRAPRGKSASAHDRGRDSTGAD